jgi:hypothetical protein
LATFSPPDVKFIVCAKALLHDEPAFKVLLWLTRGKGMRERLDEEQDLT